MAKQVSRNRHTAKKPITVGIAKTARKSFADIYGGLYLSQSFANRLMHDALQLHKAIVTGNKFIHYVMRLEEGCTARTYSFHYNPDRNTLVRFLPDT